MSDVQWYNERDSVTTGIFKTAKSPPFFQDLKAHLGYTVRDPSFRGTAAGATIIGTRWYALKAEKNKGTKKKGDGTKKV